MPDCTGTATCTCGCCAGIAIETPQAIENRAGLDAIAYRVGKHAQFKATLLARLRSSRQLALDGLRTREDTDFTIALLDAFSTMGDVLTFYTERVANEVYLRTATERTSVLNLAELIGYELRPGVAASTLLAFTVEENAGSVSTAAAGAVLAQVIPQAPPTIYIDAGTKVQSIPGPGEKPQTFETAEAITARGEWNAILPLLTQPQHVKTSSARFVLAGSQSNLKVGDVILVIDEKDERKALRLLNVTVLTGTKTKTTLSRDTSTTFVDVAKIEPGAIGYEPPKFTSPTLVSGKISDFKPNTPLTSQATQEIVKKRWGSDTLIALAKTQRWDVDQLSTLIDEAVAQTPAASGQVLVFRQHASLFGHNAPNWYSLPASMRPVDAEVLSRGRVTKKIIKNQDEPAFPDNWENWKLSNNAADGNYLIYLDKTYPEIKPGSWIVVSTPKASRILQVLAVAEVDHSEFSISGKLTRLTVKADSAIADFGLRDTSILCQSESLPLAPVPIPDDVSGKIIVLNRAYVRIQAGRKVVISGERADADSVSAAEARTLAGVALERGLTVLTLDKSLSYPYKRPTVSVSANVADATNGETVQETLGSGDGSQAFQSFVLKQSPLTYVSASTPSGTQSTLQIRVNGLLWKEAPFFFGHDANEHIYVTRQDNDGNTTVTFGDGKTGARLPTGQQNVVAQYRRGIGKGGLLRANQLSLMLARPLGVRGATNPAATEGADDPERLEDARQNATLTIKSLGRAVSLQDYEDFARAFAGIGKAMASWTWTGEERIVLLTVAGANGAAIDPEGPLYKNLQAALAAGSEPWVTVKMSPHDPLTFRVTGTVAVDAEYDAKEVARNVEAALRSTFSFANRQFGQPVHKSEVIAAIQMVEGVVSVDLTALYRSDASPGLNNDLVAAAPRPGKNEIFAAQLLTIDPAPLGLVVTQ
ncbi:MAG: putative baseplate assembly protein [Terriglobales bacterium]